MRICDCRLGSCGGKASLPSGWTCADDVVREAFRAEWWKNWRAGLRHLLVQRCCNAPDMRFWHRWFYTAKGLTCLLLMRFGSDINDWSCCAIWDEHQHSHEWCPSHACGWMELNVGSGVFRNWHVHIFSNQSY